MRGIPAVLKTRGDVERLMDMARSGSLRPQHREEFRVQLSALLASRYTMVRDRVLEPDDEPDGPEPHYRVLLEEAEDGAEERVQYARDESPTGRIFRLGLTVDEVTAMIDELEAMK